MWTTLALPLLAYAFAVPSAPAEFLAVQVSGRGRPVILVPGLCGAAYGFRNVATRLNDAGYMTVVVEPLGIGGSARPPGADYSLTAQSRRLAALLDSLALRDAVIVAHGVSASIALRLAAARPELVRAVVSLEGGAAEETATPAFRRSMRLAGMAGALLGPDFLRKKFRAEMVSVSGDPSWVTDDAVTGYLKDAFANPEAAIAGYRAMSRAREPEPLAPQLSRIHCPVELLQGGADHPGRVPAAEVALLRTNLSSFRAVLVPGAGHFLQEESPDAVITAVKRVERRATSERADAVAATAERRRVP